MRPLRHGRIHPRHLFLDHSSLVSSVDPISRDHATTAPPPLFDLRTVSLLASTNRPTPLLLHCGGLADGIGIGAPTSGRAGVGGDWARRSRCGFARTTSPSRQGVPEKAVVEVVRSSSEGEVGSATGRTSS